MVQLAHEGGVPLVEDRVQNRQHRRPLLPGRRARRRVAHEVHDAALPRGAGEDLLDRAPQPLVGVGRHAEDAGGAALPQGAQKRQPPGVGLGVDRVQAEQAPVAVGARADRRDERA